MGLMWSIVSHGCCPNCGNRMYLRSLDRIEFFNRPHKYHPLLDMHDRCQECGEEPDYLEESNVYYLLNGTNLRLDMDSPLAKIFVQIPSGILVIFTIMLLLMLFIEVVSHVSEVVNGHVMLLFDGKMSFFKILFLFTMLTIIYNMIKLLIICMFFVKEHWKK